MKCKRCGRTIRGSIKAIGAHYRKSHPAVMARGRKKGHGKRSGGGKGHVLSTGGHSKARITFYD